MKTAGTVLMAVVLIFSMLSCSKKEASHQDVVLETADSFEEIADRGLAEGRKVYGKYCSVCHGVEGRGDGFNAYNLDPKPRNFTDSSYRARLDSALIVETITSGGASVGHSALMPGWSGTLSETDIRNVSYYVMYLSRVSTD
jgi:mono/diheme cytochrome c family protein